MDISYFKMRLLYRVYYLRIIYRLIKEMYFTLSDDKEVHGGERVEDSKGTEVNSRHSAFGVNLAGRSAGADPNFAILP